MAKDGNNWMPLYIGDYLADTTHLMAAGHGAYLLLIMAYWRTGPLPDDDVALMAISRTTTKEWRRLKSQLMQFFVPENGVLRHRRIDRERQKSVEMIEKRRKQTEAARRALHSETGSVTGSVTGRPSPSPSPSPVDGDVVGTRARDPAGLAERIRALLPPGCTVVNFARIDTWLRDGCDPELDILPAIAATMARQPPDFTLHSLKFFDHAVARAKASRLAPMPEVKPNEIPEFLDRSRTNPGPSAFVAGAMRVGSGGGT